MQEVKEFHDTFGHPYNNTPGDIPDVKLRIALLQEESDEVMKAMALGDLPGVLKELCDLRYILEGIALAYGFHDVFELAFEEVHRSNMTKGIEGHAQAVEEAKGHNMVTGLRYEVKELKPGLYGLYNQTGKLIKPSSYEPANMQQFF